MWGLGVFDWGAYLRSSVTFLRLRGPFEIKVVRFLKFKVDFLILVSFYAIGVAFFKMKFELFYFDFEVRAATFLITILVILKDQGSFFIF